jgi:beta-lactamase regulating signal transducer with metallopeptidase domain/tetratricopeptide (TPR) repeat protein
MNPTLATALHFATDLALRATVLFAATALLLLLLRHRSAAARHFVGTVGLTAALLLPVLAFFPLHVEIPLLPKAAPSVAGRTGPGSVLLWAWLLGTLAVGARLAVGWLRLRRITRTAETVRDAEWIEERDAAALRLAVGRAVELKESASVPAAMTAGLLRPLLLIGRAARQWAVERRRVVFLHELAHVKRLDWVSVLVAELAVALYWFHPLAWWLSRRVRRDAERASDDLVLASGIKPSVYAGHLLGIFRSLGSPAHPVAPALAAVRPSHFEERLRAILDPGAARLWQSTAGAGWAAAGLLAATVGVTLVEPAPAPCRGMRSVASITARGSASPSRTAAASRKSASGSICPFAKKTAPASGAAAAPAATAHETFALATASEAPEATAPETETPAVESTEPDLVVHAVRSGEPSTSAWSGFGFVKASNKSRDRNGRDWYSRGMGYHHDERYPEAIEAFEKAIAAGYREDAASYNIACGYALMGNNDEAFRWLERAEQSGFDLSGYVGHDDDLDNLRTDPRWAEIKTRLRAERSDSGEARAAATRWERLEARQTSNGESYFHVGKELADAGRYDLAVKAYQGAADRDYRAGTALYNQACAHALAGDRQAALDSLSKALAAGFDQPDLFKTDDDLDSLRGDPEFARLSREARDLALPGYWTGGWGFHPERSKWREASRRFEDYAQKNPQSGRAWYNVGYASLAAERPEVAAEAFHKALELGYRKPTTMYNLACAYSHLDQKDVAFDWLFKAIDAGFDEASTIRRDEDLDNLRGDPRYRKAIEVARAHERGGEVD